MVSEYDGLILEVLKDGRKSVREMVEKLYPNIPSWDRDTKVHYLYRRCIYLEKEGKIRRVTEGKILKWELVTA